MPQPIPPRDPSTETGTGTGTDIDPSLPADVEPDDETSELDGLIQVTRIGAKAVPVVSTDEDGTEADDLAVILHLAGDLDGEEVTHRFVLPAESWEGLHTVGVRATLNFETDGASEAAIDAQAELAATVEDDDPWLPFTAALSAVLEVLEPDQYLILEAAGNRFVQIAIQDGEARVETVSNQFLPEADRLPFDDLDRLAELGWEPPTHFPEDDASRGEGSPNHFVDLPPGTDPVGVACLLVNTLRQVHDVTAPDELTYQAFDDESARVLLPTLGIARS